MRHNGWSQQGKLDSEKLCVISNGKVALRLRCEAQCAFRLRTLFHQLSGARAGPASAMRNESCAITNQRAARVDFVPRSCALLGHTN